jgi:hypothetical protein
MYLNREKKTIRHRVGCDDGCGGCGCAVRRAYYTTMMYLPGRLQLRHQSREYLKAQEQFEPALRLHHKKDLCCLRSHIHLRDGDGYCGGDE